MKIKLLLVSAIAIVGMAVYTLTLSFTNTTPLLSQLEALASGEGGESGGDSSESGNTGGNEGENPESGIRLKFKMVLETSWCQQYGWIKEPDGAGGYKWTKYPIGNGPVYVTVTFCLQGIGIEYNLNSCIPNNPCDPAKPTE